MAQIQGSINKILESSGDILLKIWSDNGDMVPNSSVDTHELNQRIQTYQKQLDDLELEIRQWLELAKKGPVKTEQTPQSQEPQVIDLLMDEEDGAQNGPMGDDLGLGDFLGDSMGDSKMDFMF